MLKQMTFVYGVKKMAKTIDYVIKRADGLYLQGIEANENYSIGGRVIQSNLHTFNEFNPVWGKEPKAIEPITAANYIKVIFEAYRWETESPKDIMIMPFKSAKSK